MERKPQGCSLPQQVQMDRKWYRFRQMRNYRTVNWYIETMGLVTLSRIASRLGLGTVEIIGDGTLALYYFQLRRME